MNYYKKYIKYKNKYLKLNTKTNLHIGGFNIKNQIQNEIDAIIDDIKNNKNK